MEGDCTRVLLMTANVGSIFEEPETMFPSWLKAFFQCVQTHKPGLLAIHCQEVGGKNYEESMQHVNHFIKTLLACEELHKYDRARIFLDEDYTASDKFTALGNLYFIHEEVPEVLLWDFVDCKFIEVEGREVLSGNIENVPIKEKAKFPQYFFPEFKWSRKGFLRTRWSINNCIFDLVNIHLFHDASNIVAMESSPSVYSANRQRALLHTLQRFENDKYSKVPFFIFGDFNFRLDSNALIQELTGKLVAYPTKGKKDQVNQIEYKEEGNAKTVLTVGSKNFDYYEKHSDLFASMNKWLHQYDKEMSSFRDRLFEFDIDFPPTYPFCEDVADGISYMKTRVPSWCDRVLLSHSVKDILSLDSNHRALYDLIGKDVCMGDHKPVYLFTHMKPGKGNQTIILESAPISPLPVLGRKRTLSINGEQVGGVDFTSKNVDLSSVNIHDYARFEIENDLHPEFRLSIKNKKEDTLTVEGGPGSGTKVMRNRSFQEVARQVCAMEKVLLKWPKRPRSRHHSSSSEDFASDDDSEVVSLDAIKTDVDPVSSEKANPSQNLLKDNKPSDLPNRDNAQDAKNRCKSVNSGDEANNNKNSIVINQVSHKVDGTVASNNNVVVVRGQGSEVNTGLSGQSTPISPTLRQKESWGGQGDEAATLDVVSLDQHGKVVDGQASDSSPSALALPQPAPKKEESKHAPPTTPNPSSSSGCCRCVVL